MCDEKEILAEILNKFPWLDDALSEEEWIDILENDRSMDIKRPKIDNDPLKWYFIMCADGVVMIRKEYWEIYLNGQALLE
jgi:hypothetical protein